MDESPANSGSSKQPRLLEQLRDAIRRKHYSYRTEETYAHWVKRFIYFSGKRHPATLGEAEVTAFLNYLARERTVAAATQNPEAHRADQQTYATECSEHDGEARVRIGRAPAEHVVVDRGDRRRGKAQHEAIKRAVVQPAACGRTFFFG